MPHVNPAHPAHTHLPPRDVVPTEAQLPSLYHAYSEDGFDDGELRHLITGIVNTQDYRPYLRPLWSAVLSPSMPNHDDKDPKFLEVLSWYVDKSTSGRGDGRLSLDEIQEQLGKYGQQYLQLSMDPEQGVARMQAWKFIQKLRILESAINDRVAQGEGPYYPYSARDMMAIDKNTPFNATNTLESRADFNQKVIEASYDKPVLVKFGLTYCAHCLLLEQLGSVPAVAEKYEDQMDVFKLWWNPQDPAYAELNALASENGVRSSPIFILYKDGEIVKHGYGFPDENGEGLEDFLGDALEVNNS